MRAGIERNRAEAKQKSEASSRSLTAAQKKQSELWAEHDKASKEYYRSQYEGDKTPPHKDPKRKAMFDTMEKAVDYQLSQ
jgi:hypothetical protein